MMPIKSWEENEELKWDPSFELGHGVIDTEHRILHKLIVDFQEAVAQGVSKEKLTRILEEIIEYAEFHFSSEEKIMADYHYPERDEHALLHNDLLADVQNKCAQFQENKIDPVQLDEFLLNWFAFHTSHEDKKLVSYINKSK